MLTEPDTAMSQQRGLILLGEVQQSLELSYDFTGKHATYAQSRASSSTVHRFEETYNFKIPYGIYSPHLLSGDFGASLGLNQERFSSTSSSPGTGSRFDMQYTLYGVFLDRQPFPVRFTSSSTRSHIQREFSGGYDLLTDTNGVGLSLKNRFLPVRVNFTRTNSETRGQSQDRIQKTDTLALNASHRVADISETEGAILSNDNRSSLKSLGGETRYTSVEYLLRNRLAWDEKNPELNSSYRYRESSGLTDDISSTWGENFTSILGNAMDAGLDYENTTTRGMGQREVSNFGGAWLQHRLYNSLTTRLAFQARDIDINSGSESDIGGSLALNYHRNLPEKGTFALNFLQRIDVVDSNRDNQRVQVLDEVLTARYFEQNFLLHENVEQVSINVRNADPTKSSILYVAGTDYWITKSGSQLQLIFLGSPTINDGDNLLVTYAYLVNPSVKYVMYSRNVGGSLALLGGMYKIYGSVSDSDQEFLSGREDVVRLDSRHSYRAGAEYKFENNTFGANYLKYLSREDKHQTFEGFGNHERQFVRGYLTLYLKDTYTRQEENSFAGADAKAYSENLIKVGASYRRILFGLADMKLRADYANSRSGIISRDFYSIVLTTQMNIRNTLITFLAQVNWQELGSNSTRDERVRLDFTRYF